MDQTGKDALKKQCPVPSQAQLALAIAIVNSKPTSISVIDHLQHICLHIKSTRNHSPSSTSSSDKYFDSVAFWKQAYTKAEATQSKLNDRIYELEQRVETLKLKLKQEDNLYDTPERGKRKGSQEPTVPESQRKRKKTNNASAGIGLSSEAELERLTELVIQENSNESRINSIMRHLSILQQNLQKRPNWPVLYSSVLNLCTATGSIVPCFYDSLGSEPRQSNNTDSNIKMLNPIVVLAVIESAHALLCRALNKIMDSSQSQKYEGQITYQLASLFEKLLYALAKICEFQAGSRRINQSSKSTSAKNAQQQSSPELSNAFLCGISVDEVLQSLRRVLASMMLKATALITDGPNSLFEGYLYVILTRVGTVLSVLEFKDIVTSPDLQTSSDNLPLPHGLCRPGINGEGKTLEATIIAYETETCHLVWLLEKAVALVHSISMKSLPFQSATAIGGGKDSNAGILISLSKKRLQNTLLKAVFHEDEPLFLESLKKPQCHAGDESKTQINETSEPPSEWFSREVWRLLGWDILESIWKNGNENHMK
ncbi:hypothetical protein EYB26_005859 [Talaromyces marneffei]|uniref:uncharacterized protein n=1 Tax=Talaromyces marneffei TaxID=37727 RepID=UPI0012A88C54|nr:uncharacterized protein EYB26_005859 [Talaromyces marneffei]QGA18175.1 hypothetical protein EYB26_005859 [Talaromyces marneffei]